jgi:hypothetical protein
LGGKEYLMASLDTLSTIGTTLTGDHLDIAGGIKPMDIICWFFPELCNPFYF